MERDIISAFLLQETTWSMNTNSNQIQSKEAGNRIVYRLLAIFIVNLFFFFLFFCLLNGYDAMCSSFVMGRHGQRAHRTMTGSGHGFDFHNWRSLNMFGGTHLVS